MTPQRELQLVDAYRRGDADAIGELLTAYQRRIYSVCYRMVATVDEANDLTQDVLVKVIEGIDSYDGRSKLSTWVIRVAMNCCLSHLRKQKVRRHQSLDEPRTQTNQPLSANLPTRREPGGSSRVEQAETRSILLEALGDLESDMRSVLVLRDLQDLDYQQIAEVLAIPVGTVKSRLFRARAALRVAAEARMGQQEPHGGDL